MMDGLFTVFGLGTAFGVFCSWMYDVIRKKNLPASRGATFEQFHGADVMPAPEPLNRGSSAENPMHGQDEIQRLHDARDKKEGSDGTVVTKNEPVFTPTNSNESDLLFPSRSTGFADTVSFEYSNPVFPTKEGGTTNSMPPRVVLLVNDSVVRDVQEKDLPDLMNEFGIVAESVQAQLFQGGDLVTIGRNRIQLAQA